MESAGIFRTDDNIEECLEQILAKNDCQTFIGDVSSIFLPTYLSLESDVSVLQQVKDEGLEINIKALIGIIYTLIRESNIVYFYLPNLPSFRKQLSSWMAVELMAWKRIGKSNREYGTNSDKALHKETFEQLAELPYDGLCKKLSKMITGPIR